MKKFIFIILFSIETKHLQNGQVKVYTNKSNKWNLAVHTENVVDHVEQVLARNKKKQN